MPMYALATLPLIKELKSIKNVKQVWYADDASSTGKVKDLYEWWKKLTTLGPRFGYSPNAMKTWLVTKEEHLTTATTQFANEGVNITIRRQTLPGCSIRQTRIRVLLRPQQGAVLVLYSGQAILDCSHSTSRCLRGVYPFKNHQRDRKRI